MQREAKVILAGYLVEPRYATEMMYPTTCNSSLIHMCVSRLSCFMIMQTLLACSVLTDSERLSENGLPSTIICVSEAEI